MIQLEFHPEAEEELMEAERWYRERSEVASQAFALEISLALDSVLQSPERWPRTHLDERRFVLDRFPYSVLYRINADTVYVMAIAHHKRRPGYWRRRK